MIDFVVLFVFGFETVVYVDETAFVQDCLFRIVNEMTEVIVVAVAMKL